MFIQTEDTPNPSTLKFLPGRDVLGEGRYPREYARGDNVDNAPMAGSLFFLEGVERVFLGADFISITKSGDVEWKTLKARVLGAIMDHFTQGFPVVTDDAADSVPADEPVYEGEVAEIVDQIKELIELRVRPAVAQDGGDIVFQRFDARDGVVYLTMRGACAGCPSSTMTLKNGIENLLKHYVPEVTAVEAAA